MTNRCILNLGNLGFGQNQYAFTNFFKSGIQFQDALSNWLPILSANGTPSSAPADNNLGVGVYIPPSYIGVWTLKWSGTGGMKVTFDTSGFTISAGFTGTLSGCTVGHNTGTTLTIFGSNVYVQFQLDNPTISHWVAYFISGVSYSGGMGEPILVRADQEAALASGKYINPDYLALLTQLNPSTLRFMQWEMIDSNNSNSKPYTYKKPQNYFTWSDCYYPLGAIAGGTAQLAGSAGTYTCTAAPDTPGSITNGEMIIAYATSNLSMPATLNVGGRGAKSVIDYTGANIIYQGAGCYTYDKTADIYVYVNTGLFDGAPIDVIIGLCNQLNANCYYCLPPLSIDSENNSLSTYFANNLTPGLSWWLEWGNEIWNTGVGNLGSQIAKTWNPIVSDNGEGGSADAQAWRHHGTMIGITSAWNTTGRPQSQLKRVLACSQNSDTVKSYMLPGLHLSNWGDNYPALGGTNPWNTSTGWPELFTDVIAIGSYLNGPNTPAFAGYYILASSQAGLYTAADNYASGNSTLMANALAWVDNDLRAGTGGANDHQTLGDFISTYYPAFEAVAAIYDGSRSVPLEVDIYEGGLQIGSSPFQYPSVALLEGTPGLSPTNAAIYGGPLDHTGATGRIATLYNAYKHSSLCYQFVLDYFNAFLANPHSRYACWYDFNDGSFLWQLFEGDLYSPTFKSFNAIEIFDGGLPPPTPPGKFRFKGNLGLRLHA